MTGDIGAVSAAQERVRVFEPEPGWTISGHPLLNELHERGRKRVRRGLVVFPLSVVAMIAVLLPDVPLIGAGPFIGMLGLGLLAVVAQLITYFYTVRPSYGLRNAPFFEVRPAELLVSGRKISFPLPGDGERRWVVVKLASAQRVVLAGIRRMWLLGPDQSGRVGVLLPGAVAGRGGWIRAEPAPGSVLLAAQSREPVAPKDDPVLRAYFRTAARTNLIFATLQFAAAGLAFWTFGGIEAPDGIGDFAVGLMLGLAVMMVLLGCCLLVPLYRLHQAITVPNWTELGIRLDGGIQANGTIVANAAGRVLLSDGREVTVKLPKANVNLLATVAETGRLWVLGTPRPGSRAYVGLPGYALLSVVKFGE
jgi:hypothetical protein